MIDLTRARLLGVLAGADLEGLADRGDLVVRGDRAGGLLILRTISAPAVLACLTARLTRREPAAQQR